jgi:hypothetical protein
MKYLTFGSISALFLFIAAAPAAIAQEGERSTTGNPLYLSQYEEPEVLEDNLDNELVEAGELVDEYSTTPFELVSLARRGYFENQGIPAYGAFEQSIALNEIDVDDIIQAGIDAGRLEPIAYQDEGYEFAVRLQVRALADDLL